MQGVWQRLHDRERHPHLHPESSLFAVATMVAAILTVLFLLLAVFVTRAS